MGAPIPYKVVLKRWAQAGLLQVSAADPALFLRVRDIIYALASEPRPPESFRLVDLNAWYLRVGDVYVSYVIDDIAQAIEVSSVWRRGDSA